MRWASRAVYDAVNDGYWKISGKRQPVYGRSDLSVGQQMVAARKLTNTTDYDWSTHHQDQT
jgi:hypothetical protein